METPIETLKDTLAMIVAISKRDKKQDNRKESKSLIPQYKKAIKLLEKPVKVEIYGGDDLINGLF